MGLAVVLLVVSALVRLTQAPRRIDPWEPGDPQAWARKRALQDMRDA